MIIKRKSTRVLARLAFTMSSTLALVLGTLGGSSAAFATPAPAATQETQVGMYVSGFDAAVAKAHGYQIVTYANGDQQSIPIDPQSKLPKSQILHPQSPKSTGLPSRQARPAAPANTDYNEVWGNCGRSWIRVTQTGTNQVAIVSGFSNTPATAFFWSWDVLLSDQNGVSHQTYSGAISDDKASRIWPGLFQYILTYDYVYSGGAALVDGTICLAGRPDVAINTI
jgi:hypothetical protein